MTLSIRAEVPLKKRRFIRRVSPKRATELREYAKKRKAFLEAHPYCQFWINEHLVNAATSLRGFTTLEAAEKFVISSGGSFVKFVCVPRSTEVHHKNKRFGSRLNDETYWMAVSREAHEWIENHKNEAREKGYLLNY